MKMRGFCISAVVCLCLASVSGFLEFGNNEVDDGKADRYELKSPCVTLIRAQINLEMYASLVYMHMAAHFDKNGVSKKGFSNLFRENSKEEREHALKLIDYLNLRGSKLMELAIDMPSKTAWTSGLEALNEAIVLEKEVYNKLNHIHDVAEITCKDSHLMDFLEGEYLKEQIESIDAFIRHASELGSISDDVLGEYLYDKRLLNQKIEL